MGFTVALHYFKEEALLNGIMTHRGQQSLRLQFRQMMRLLHEVLAKLF
jgi:hemerythrin-like domain-containing protein